MYFYELKFVLTREYAGQGRDDEAQNYTGASKLMRHHASNQIHTGADT